MNVECKKVAYELKLMHAFALRTHKIEMSK